MVDFSGRRLGANGAFGAQPDQQQSASSIPNAFGVLQPAGSPNPLTNRLLSQPGLSRYGLAAKYIETPDEGGETALDWAQNEFRKFQKSPMPRPNLAESFIPVVGPAWDAVADLHDGNYGGAAFNGAMAVADVLPIGTAFKGLKAAEKGAELFERIPKTAQAAQKLYHERGLAKAGEEVHHVFPLNGIKRNVPNWRNRHPFLKVLPQETHQRLTRRWNSNPRFGPMARAWYGTTDWMKTVPVGLTGYAADAWENLTHPFDGEKPLPSPSPTTSANRVIQPNGQAGFHPR